METSKQTSILIDCIDLLTGVPFLSSDNDNHALANNLIDTLGNYPRPQTKNEATPAPPQHLGAYLYTSTARNSLKLAQLGYMPFTNAFSVASGCFEASLSLLTDKE